MRRSLYTPPIATAADSAVVKSAWPAFENIQPADFASPFEGSARDEDWVRVRLLICQRGLKSSGARQIGGWLHLDNNNTSTKETGKGKA